MNGGGANAATTGEHAREAALATMLQLHWFIKLRWAFLLGALFVFVGERYLHASWRRPDGLGLALFGLAATNVVWMALSNRLRAELHARNSRTHIARTRYFANAQVALDLILLTLILRYTGGIENPMIVFYLFHMAIVALLLTRTQALLQGVLATTAFAALACGEASGLISPHYDLLPGKPDLRYADWTYVGAVSFAIIVGVFGMLFFTLYIARRLEARERALERSNRMLRQSQVAIQDLQERRSRFMQTAAHQLKSPLATIHTLTDLIRNRIIPADSVCGTCDKIIHRCQCGISQVTELLTLARLQESDPRRHVVASADLCAVVDVVVRELSPLAERQGVTLELERAADVAALPVGVDRRDLRDCVGNLIENAIKYTPGPGHVDVSVAREAAPHGGWDVVFTVADTGIGLDPELLRSARHDDSGEQVLFDAFRRGNNAIAAGIPGTGLGMSIVQEVIEQAGGKIWVRSAPGAGTTFVLRFPMMEGDTNRVAIRTTRASVVCPSPSSAVDTAKSNTTAHTESRTSG